MYGSENLDLNELLEAIKEGGLNEILTGLRDVSGEAGTIFATLTGIFVAIISIILFFALIYYIISSIGLSKLAKYQGIEHSWFAWLPFTRNYLLGEMADIYNKSTWIRYVLLGISIGGIFLNLDVLTYASYGFAIYSYYLIFKAIKPETYVGYTIGSLFGLGPIFLCFMKNENKAGKKEENVKEAKFEEKKEEVKEEQEEELHCPKCGDIVEKDAKFCGSCGSKLK